MKLAKKVITVVVVLAIASVLAFSAFAAEASIVMNAPKNATVGDTVKVDVSLANAKGWESGTFVITFDNAKLQYVEQVRGNGFTMSVGKNISDNQATVAVAYDEASEVDSVDVVTVTFKVIAAGDATVSFGVLDGDYAPADAAPADASVTVACAEKAAPSQTAPAESTTAGNGNNQGDVTSAQNKIPETGDAGIAVAAGLVVLAGAAFVASKKTK